MFELLGFGAQLFAFLRCPEELAAQELEEFGGGSLELFGCEFDVRWELDERWGGGVGEVLQVDDVVVGVVGVGCGCGCGCVGRDRRAVWGVRM